jgi:hypothetical protein
MNSFFPLNINFWNAFKLLSYWFILLYSRLHTGYCAIDSKGKTHKRPFYPARFTIRLLNFVICSTILTITKHRTLFIGTYTMWINNFTFSHSLPHNKRLIKANCALIKANEPLPGAIGSGPKARSQEGGSLPLAPAPLRGLTLPPLRGSAPQRPAGF